MRTQPRTRGLPDPRPRASGKGAQGGEDGVHPDHEINPGVDHGGGVDQSADGGGAFHRVGEPDVKRDLSRLGHRTDKNQKPDQDQFRDPVETAESTWAKPVVPREVRVKTTAMSKETSPILVTAKALNPALRADSLSVQKAMRRAEQIPTISQNRYSWSRFPAMTSPSIAPTKTRTRE